MSNPNSKITQITQIFKYNYLRELPDDIKTLIYNRVYKSNYSLVLNELCANIENRKHYYNLKQFLVYQDEPKLNLLNHLLTNIKTQRMREPHSSIISCYKNHLTSNHISKANINKLKIASNVFAYLNKKIANTFIAFLKNSRNAIYNIYIEDNGEYFVLEYDGTFCCYAAIYLMALSFWKFIRCQLYEFYQIHLEAYNIHVNKLLKDDYDTGLFCWYAGNINDETLDKNLIKIKNENAKLYRTILRHRGYVNKTEGYYIHYEIRNIIDKFVIENNTMIIRLKEL
jgi:hypothetical protein